MDAPAASEGGALQRPDPGSVSRTSAAARFQHDRLHPARNKVGGGRQADGPGADDGHRQTASNAHGEYLPLRKGIRSFR